MERDPSRRLACKPNGEGFEELKRHPWFSTIDWATLDSKEQIAPFIPDVCIMSLPCPTQANHANVLQSKKANFDASHELEELLLEDNPLRAKQRKERDITSLSAEMRQMEEQYVIPSPDTSSLVKILSVIDPSSSQIHSVRLQEDEPPVVLSSDADHLVSHGHVFNRTDFLSSCDAHDDR